MTSSNRFLLVATILIVLQLGCVPSARYPLRLHDLDERQLLERAALVIVGKTLAVHWESARLELRWSKQYGVSSVRLVRMRLSVEQVIRGSVEHAEITAYYWAPEVFTNGRALHLPVQGGRAIHYLVTDQGVLRYVADVMRSTTPVLTGYHRQLPKAVGSRAEAKIAAVLLTPGEGMNVARFVTDLSTGTGNALRLVGFVGTLPLLKSLADSPVRDVKWAACVELFHGGFEGHSGCIDRFAPGAIADGREAEFRKLGAQRRAAAAQFRHRFLSDPIRTARESGVLPGNIGIADYLSMVAGHPDREIALRAQKVLQTRCRNGPV